MSRTTITDQVPLRTMILLCVSVLGLSLLAGYLYVIKPPLAELAELEDTVFETRRSRPIDGPADVSIAALERDIADLEARLGGSGRELAPNEMVAFVIGQLDLIARSRHVQLVSVEPGAVARVFEFDEIPFHIEVVGGYFHLVDWLQEAEQKLGPMVIKSFEISPSGGENSRRMHLTMVSYRTVRAEA